MPDWEQISQLYHNALGLPDAQREAFLRDACAGDEILRREVESLLTQESSPGFLAQPAAVDMTNAGSANTSALMEGQKIGAYTIVAPLGAGGMGRVYRAHDEYLRRDVAIKIVPDASDRQEGAVERGFREARAASALNHPHIVTIHGAGRVEAGHFLVMELVRGRTLRSLIGKPLDVDTLRDLGVQIAKALAAAHEVGIVHRDIKPENVMVRDDGYIKILDFGLARLESFEPNAAGTVTQRAFCTPRYVSPERARGGAGDAATDIFSFGILLHELATGRHPFVGDSAYAITISILSDQPVSPGRLNVDLPADIEALILQMLEKEPARRPSAADVARVLATPLAVGRRGIDTKIESAPRIVGRAREQSELHAALEQAASGRGMLMCVTGEPGIGKSTLVEGFLTELEGTTGTCRVARGRCSERLAGNEAYLPILDALDHLLRANVLDTSSMVRLLKTVAPLWHAQVASTVTDALSAASIVSVATSQERLKRELTAFLEEASRLQPLVIFFDDIHWADISTVDLLSYVATRFTTMRILIIVSYRPEELLREKHPFLRVKQDLQARGCCRELALDFLTPTDLETYVGVEFAHHKFPATFAAMLHEKTEGNPLFVVDVLRYLRDQRILLKEDGCWTLGQALPDIARALPESVRSMIQRKVDLLEEGDRRLLVTASVQGYEFDAVVVAHVLGMDQAEVEERLDRLDRIHAFVRGVREWEFPDHTVTMRYRFVHLLYQNFLYSTLTTARRVALAREVVRTLQALYRSQVGDIAVEIAMLCLVAREFDAAADYFLTAAQRAARVFAYQEAIRLASRGLEALHALPDDPERKRRELALLLTLSLPVAAAMGFSHPRAEEVYDRARVLCLELNESLQLVKAVRGLFIFNLVGLRLDIAQDLARKLVSLSEDAEDPLLRIVGPSALGWNEYFRGNYVAAEQHLRHALYLYDPKPHRKYVALFGTDIGSTMKAVQALVSWTMGMPDRAVSEIAISIELAREIKHADTLSHSLFFAVVLYQFRREWERARASAEELLALTIELGLSHYQAAARNFLAYDLVQHGRSKEAIEDMHKSMAAYHAAGAQTSRARFKAQLAEELGQIGQVEEGLDLLAHEISATGPARIYLAELYRVQGNLFLQRDHPDAARDAESSLITALEVAREQNAKAFELRAAMSVWRCWQQQGKAGGRQLLSETYACFTEGLDTGDLVEAKGMLDSAAV